MVRMALVPSSARRRCAGSRENGRGESERRKQERAQSKETGPIHRAILSRRFELGQERETAGEKADARIRTADPFITSEVLYQLSYVGGERLV